MISYNIKGDIINGKRVGDFQIGSTYNDNIFRQLITRDKSNEKMPDSVIHEIYRNIVLFLNDENIIQEIVAMNNYRGKVNGLFGIGDCLKDFKSQVNYETSEYDSEGYFYFPDMPGLRILADKWDEEGSKPIKFISIFDPELGPVI